MHQEIIIGLHHRGRGHVAMDYLRQEIAFFEARLTEMGERGDCAYEHALSKAYQVLRQERSNQLAALQFGSTMRHYPADCSCAADQSVSRTEQARSAKVGG